MLINQLFESTYSQYDKPTYLRNNPKEPTKKSSWTGVDMEIPAYKRKEQAELEKKRLNNEAVNYGNAYPGLGDDVVDKKKKLNPQPNLTMKPKRVKDFIDKTYKGYSEEVELDESLITGTKKISTHEAGQHKAEVRHNSEYNEFQVHYYKDGKHRGEGPVSYHENDRADATASAKREIERLGKTQKEDVEQIDELSKGTLASYANKAVGDVSKDRSKNIKLADKKLYGNPNLNYKNEGTAYKATNPHPASRDPIVATVVKQMRPGLTGLEMGNEAFLYFAYELGKMRARDSWEDYLPAIRAEYEKGVNEDVNTDNKLAKLLTRFINQNEGADRAVAGDAIEYIKKMGHIEQFATSLDYFGVDLDEGDSTVDAEKKQVIRALKNEWQFDRKRHGSLFDRGSADSYYRRSRDPHYGGVGGDSGNRVKVTDAESIAEYLAGFQDNEENGDRKDYS